tara:strand:+ start:177 stop:383 length:207 start_codon:yes stop_codon:yes gene_type:complete
MYDIELMTISIGIPVLFSLYLMFRGVEYRESIRRLQQELEQTKEANRNLAKIIQDDIERQFEYEKDCG